MCKCGHSNRQKHFNTITSTVCTNDAIYVMPFFSKPVCQLHFDKWKKNKKAEIEILPELSNKGLKKVNIISRNIR